MKNFKTFIKGLIIGAIIFGGIAIVQAAPVYILQKSILPEQTNTFYLGSTSPDLEWNGIYTKNLTVTGTCTGCGGGGTNYFTNSGINTYLNTGSQLQAPYFNATSTTATSTYAGAIWVNTITGSTSALTITTSNANQAAPIIISPGAGVGLGSNGGGLFLVGSKASGTLSNAGQTGIISPDGNSPADIVISAGTSTGTNGNIQFGTNGSYLYNGTLTQITTPQMTVAGNGKIGINNTTPSAMLDIYNSNSSSSDILVHDVRYPDGLIKADSVGQLYLGDCSGDVNDTCITISDFAHFTQLLARDGFDFVSDATTTFAAFSTTGKGIDLSGGCYAINGTCIGSGGGSGIVGTGIAGQLPYYAANGTTLTATSTITIGTTTTNNGNVGIKTVNPANALDVNGFGMFGTSGNTAQQVMLGQLSSFPAIWFGANTGSPSLTNYSFLYDSNIGTVFNAALGKTIRFRTNNVDQISVFPGSIVFGANTGQATATPFNVSFGGTYGTSAIGSAANLKWTMYNDGAGSAGYYGIGMSASLMEVRAGTGASIGFFPDNASSEVMTAQSGGVIFGGSGSTADDPVTFTASTGQKIHFYSAQPNGYVMGVENGELRTAGGTASTDKLTWYTQGYSGTERMRLDGSGNLGIGTTSPDSKLDVNGSVRFEGASSFVTTSISGAIIGIGCDSADTTGLSGLASTTAFVTTPQSFPGNGLFTYTMALTSTSARTFVCSSVTVTPNSAMYSVKIIR